MIWPKEFADRLTAWTELRTQVRSIECQEALGIINAWWHQTPWKPYYLHWDDQPSWPDPWQLLSDDVYCPVARALGILYTISLLDRADMVDAELVLTDQGDNLVLVGKTKYILNWSPDTVVNKNLTVKITRQYKKHQIK